MKRGAVGSVAMLAAVVACMAGRAHAADDDGNYAVRGTGSQACSQFLESVESEGPALEAFATWIDGFVTAHNRTGDQTFDSIPVVGTEPLVSIVRNVCKQNPELSVEAATARLLELLTPYRVDSQSPIMEIQGDEGATRLRRETLVLVQKRLAAEGVYDGEADGEFDDTTRAAIRRYQEKRGLQVTGLPGPATVLWLIRDAENDQ